MHFYTRKTCNVSKSLFIVFFIYGQNNRSNNVVHNKLCLCLGQSGWVINYS